ncbi:MAG: hypothetical protein HC772_11775 [Leptolyngbyaceae cyanobacterium CRU_2_3]|nr:hypothetical protein [Leptolyngbyaceae cyanobacterium CRU_2_3]
MTKDVNLSKFYLKEFLPESADNVSKATILPDNAYVLLLVIACASHSPYQP